MPAGTGDKVDLKSLPKMVRWYSPAHLVKTGWRSVVSEIFGQYADQRIMQATIDGFTPEVMKEVIARYNYSDLRGLSDGETMWADYVADLGDGFDSTYAMASLISAPSLDIEGAGKLPGGKLLIMGGDQVYPYPSRKDYRDRLEFPYKTALPSSSDGNWRRLLFVLPGNHDWYDGLNSFDYMFCKARFGHANENRIGGWLCPQHRSYFAIRLPHNWWIWGADIQLAQYLDAGQILYFESVAEEMKRHPTEAPKLILCTPEPSWSYDKDDQLQGEDNLSQIAEIADRAGARICAVLAGDLHHYSRYTTADTATNFVTSGGGGAYFSPTHYLKSKRHTPWLGEETQITMDCKVATDGTPTKERSCWPSRTRSRFLSLKTLMFPFTNYGFSVALGIFYWLMIWVFSTTTLPAGDWKGWLVGDVLTNPNSGFHVFPHIFMVAPLAAATNVMLGILSLALWIVLFLYADSAYGTRGRLVLGSLHWLAHVSMMIVLYFAVSYGSVELMKWVWPQAREALETLQARQPDEWREIIRTIVVFPPMMIFLGGIAAGFVWGAYLTICCLIGLHPDQAFASMAIPDYKSFLRLKIEPNKLTIYPIGLKRTPRRWAWHYARGNSAKPAEGPAIVSGRPMRPKLIEGPIEIRVGDVKRRNPEPIRTTVV